MCYKDCHKDSCPFADTERSEIAQNYGCLPTPLEIVGMRIFKGKTWACHSDTSRPCKGAISFLKKKGLDSKVIDKDLIDERNITKELIQFTEDQRQEIIQILVSLD